MGIGSFRGWRPFVFSLPLLISLPILFSVSELHRKSNPVQDLSRKHTKKFDHLVLGPAAGQGLCDRLQCRGLKALNRTHSSPTSRILNSSDSISRHCLCYIQQFSDCTQG
ncbi:uncharacterized protein LOC131256719 [Magnolia sinica]|uniref:uncharacterized protein LOC131256719 n=1 Tax=Magnolia sinica TaxID=86752 RepID=UPI002657CD26|nr:uncharacterized protein LOC131256719 [Magnolia sinica]